MLQQLSTLSNKERIFWRSAAIKAQPKQNITKQHCSTG